MFDGDELLWRWPTPLREGRLLRRYERFVAEVELAGGARVRAHCVNPGRMEGLVVPGARVWLSEARAGRALGWTWELVELDGVLVGANTALPNQLARALLERSLVGAPSPHRRCLAGFSGLTAVRPEQPFGQGHRVDFLLEGPSGPRYVEVKNCHLAYPDRGAYFPDSRSERATAHAEELGRLAARGVAASVLFTVQRLDADVVRPSALHDPAFADALRRAVAAGVTVHAVRLAPTLEGLRLDAELPVDVAPYDPRRLEPWAAALAPTSGWTRKDGRVAGASPPRVAPARAPRRAG